MMFHSRKQALLPAGFTAGAALVLWITLTKVVAGGPVGRVLEDTKTLQMLGELAFMFLWNLFFLGTVKDDRLRLAGLLGGNGVFLWLHQILIPLLGAGIYMGALAWAGKTVLLGLFWGRGNREIPPLEQWFFGLALGSAFWILFVCGLSLMGLGGVRLWRGCGMALCLCWLGAEAAGWLRRKGSEKCTPFRLTQTRTEAILLAFILTMLLLQAGRLNIELDYDSLHYGLRSPYVLDNGNGIYENLGMVNLVYTYSKGLEVLALPLSGTSTYGFVLAFSFWATVGILVLAAGITGSGASDRAGKRRRGLWAAAVISAIPGIMNMAATAKCDNMTLLFQLLIFNLLGLSLKGDSGERRAGPPWLLMAVSVYLLTLVFKPTALVFATALGGVGLICHILERRRPEITAEGIFLLIPTGLAAAGLMYRTWRMTGVPMTSIFAGPLEGLGFEIRYPFNFNHVIGDPSALTTAEKLARLAERLKGILFAPVGEDMAHVIIAWGTGLILLLGVLWLAGFFMLKNKRTPLDRFEALLLAVLLLGSLASIYTLYQVDGNYFTLFYAVLAMSAVGLADRFGERGLRRQLAALAVPLFLCNALIACTTSWAGVPGLTPIHAAGRGLYDHRAERDRRREAEGSLALSRSFEPDTRVLAFGEHPAVLDLPCVVQSYYDVTGSGGNVYLVKKLAYFEEFLDYAGIEYFFVEAGYLAGQPRALEIIEDMIEEGTLTDLCFEWGNMRAAVDLDGAAPEDPAAALALFYENYAMEGK